MSAFRERGIRGLGRAVERGQRVFLRYPDAEDQREYTELRSGSAEFHRPWEPAPLPGRDPLSQEGFRAYLERARSERHDFQLLCRLVDGAIVGAFSLSEIVRGSLQSAYLGYWIGVGYARQGFMREGLRLELDHAFVRMGLHRIEANIQPHNEASLALARSAGFRREGYSPRYLEIAGEWRDHERWALLADEHRSSDSAPEEDSAQAGSMRGKRTRNTLP